MTQSPPAAFNPLHNRDTFSADSKGADKSAIVDARRRRVGAANNRLASAKRVRVFRLAKRAKEMREALERWAGHVKGLTNG